MEGPWSVPSATHWQPVPQAVEPQATSPTVKQATMGNQSFKQPSHMQQVLQATGPTRPLDHQKLCFPGNLKGPRCKPCSVQFSSFQFSSIQLFKTLLGLKCQHRLWNDVEGHTSNCKPNSVVHSYARSSSSEALTFLRFWSLRARNQ